MKIDIPLKIETTEDYGDLKLPSYAKPGDAGLDLLSVEQLHVHVQTCVWVRTGVKIEIPEGFVGLLVGRSGNAFNKSLFCPHVGVIDSGFRGEIKIAIRNDGEQVRSIERGQRIGQLLLLPVATATLFPGVLSESVRGEGGFGHTGS